MKGMLPCRIGLDDLSACECPGERAGHWTWAAQRAAALNRVPFQTLPERADSDLMVFLYEEILAGAFTSAGLSLFSSLAVGSLAIYRIHSTASAAFVEGPGPTQNLSYWVSDAIPLSATCL